MDRSQLDLGTNTRIDNEYILREILDDNVYQRYNTVKDGDVVLDIGANVGVFPFSLQNKRLRKVVCVEPSRGLLPALEKNLSQLPFTTQIVCAGIGETSGYKAKGSHDYIFGDANESFETITFEDLTKQYQLDHVDFLKIDCEGGEYSVFTEANYDYLTKRVGYIAGEWHMYTIEDGIRKFNDFARLFLKGKSNFRVFEPIEWKEVTNEIVDPDFVQRYHDWWVGCGAAANFAVYIDNRVAPWTL